MKLFKTLFLIATLLVSLHCKRERKTDIISNIMPNGKYSFYYEDTPRGSRGYGYYYLKDNVFYMTSTNKDTTCFSRVAGSLFYNQDESIGLTSLQISSGYDPCVFLSDPYIADTMIYIFSNVTEATDSYGKKYLKGNVRFQTAGSISYLFKGVFALGQQK